MKKAAKEVKGPRALVLLQNQQHGLLIQQAQQCVSMETAMLHCPATDLERNQLPLPAPWTFLLFTISVNHHVLVFDWTAPLSVRGNRVRGGRFYVRHKPQLQVEREFELLHFQPRKGTMTAAGTGEGFGAQTWWGFSPALDLQMQCLQSSMEHLRFSEDIPELNILLVGCGDSRHLLKTICQAHRWPRRKLNFYVVENNLEVVGRHMLFLTLALENPEQMGLQEKSEVFLELYGNSLIRSHTATYLREKSDLFIRYVTDTDFQHSKMPLLNLTALKFKERDRLEAIFKFWRNADPQIFQVDKLWDIRNRQYLGSRYDSRKGSYDWDLSMKLHDRGAGVINNREYSRWREKGVAFEIREGIYDVPNKCLASGLIMRHKGEKVPARGYWGDIATGPFMAFGIESEEESLLKTANGIHVKTAQDVSEYNITALFHELVTGKSYSPPTISKTESEAVRLCEILEVEGDEEEEKDKEDEEAESTKKESQSQVEEDDFIPLNDVKVHFLPLNCISELHHKNKYLNLFNLIYFSCSMVHYLKPDLTLVSARKATLVVELAKFMVDLQKEQIRSFAARVTALSREAGFVSFGIMDGEKDDCAKFELVDNQ
ncbi:dynein axonemal assembly factor 3 isoform X2 [Ascaphus truei]|uniref:dynein axonemal assembly factor 3 isoform X2 n=1 Tax=Ascaphus truei TaxID=8439 RepID=UPI003F5A6C3D